MYDILILVFKKLSGLCIYKIGFTAISLFMMSIDQLSWPTYYKGTTHALYFISAICILLFCLVSTYRSAAERPKAIFRVWQRKFAIFEA